MSRLVLDSKVIVAVAAAAILCCFPRLWFRPDGRLRRVIQIGAWVTACLMLALNSLARPIYDDEVFYMAQAFAAQRAAVPAYLPLRVWAYYPFLALHLSPAVMVLASRVATMCGAILASFAVTSIARRIGGCVTASVAGALSALTFANMPMGTMVPEYVAFFFLMAGIWALLAAPPRWPRAVSLFTFGFMLALACSTSLRLLLFGIGGLVAVFLEPAPLKRAAALSWAFLGMLAGVLPSLFHIMIRESIGSVIYWHYTFMNRIGLVQITSPVELPAVLAIIAVAGCYFLWQARCRIRGSSALLVLWVTATVSAILNPQKLEHTLGPWIALSFIVAAVAMNACLTRTARAANKRAYVIMLCLLFLTQMAPNAATLASPAEIRETLGQAASGLRLINWLARVANGNPVACVPPFHPIVAPNAWAMYNVIYYCYIRDPQMNSELEPHLEDTLRSKKVAVVQWDPWPGEAEAPNILQYLIDRRFVSPEKIPLLAQELSKNYRLVKWIGPLPEQFGGGRFLVRRDVKLDNQVRLLDDELILNQK